MFRRSEAVPLEPIAVGWGGLVGGAALIAATAAGTAGAALALAGCVAGGFLAGIRSPGRRALHGLLAGALTLGFYLAFITLAHLAQVAGVSASAPDLLPGGRNALIFAPLVVVAAGLGALLSDRLLRPRKPRRLGA